MLKLLNILVVAYLAIAPGMNVEAFIHSVNLCAYTAPQVAAEAPSQTIHCGHNHSCPAPDTPDEPEDCPHIHEAVPPANVMPVVQVQSFDQLPCPALNEVSTLAAGNAHTHVPATDDSRPPPGPDVVATTILLI